MEVSIEVERSGSQERPWKALLGVSGMCESMWYAASKEAAICGLTAFAVDRMRGCVSAANPEWGINKCHDEALRLLEEAKLEALKPPENPAVKHLRDGGYVVAIGRMTKTIQASFGPSEAELLRAYIAKNMETDLQLLVEKP